LQADKREEPDWPAVPATFTRRPGFWQRLVELAAALSSDPHVDAEIGWERDAQHKAVSLSDTVISPMVVRYARDPRHRLALDPAQDAALE
jgi:hypothetical protein